MSKTIEQVIEYTKTRIKSFDAPIDKEILEVLLESKSEISELKELSRGQDRIIKQKEENIEKLKISLNDAREFLRELELNNAMVKSGRLQEQIKHLSE